MPGLSDAHPIWPHVTSTRDNCLGAKCGEFSRCHVAVARRTAQESDVVVVNHHLLLADLALKQDGFGDILGTADAVILDEAHQIPDLATQFFGASVSSRRIDNVVRDVQANVLVTARHSPALAADGWDGTVSESLRAVSNCLAEIANLLPRQPMRIDWAEGSTRLNALVEDLAHALHDLATQLEPAGEDSPLGSVAERVSELAIVVERIAGIDDLEGTRSVEITQRGFTLSLLPFDIATHFQKLIHCAPVCMGVYVGDAVGGRGLQALHESTRSESRSKR